MIYEYSIGIVLLGLLTSGAMKLLGGHAKIYFFAVNLLVLILGVIVFLVGISALLMSFSTKLLLSNVIMIGSTGLNAALVIRQYLH